ncbi:MAG: CoB--CoM heterodisulfide reductase iron-sulfur subunit B family protein [Candidatus Scalindua sp.]|nr:CoB--CoM heterodisulfide reductase iron-sulfur subunit B family protein [Candidatus Scalindua sp.]
MKIGYYPGCAITRGSSSEEYGMSVMKVSQVVGPVIEEIPDWNCCGASSAHATNHKLSTALSVRNLSLAEKYEYKEILAPCPMCSQRLIISQKDVQDDEALRKEVEDAIEMPCGSSVKVSNYLEIIKNYCMDEIAQKIKKSAKGLKVACYYGCLLVRPPKVLKFDDPEDPQSMDEIVKAIGAQPVDWEFKTNCCGGGFTLSRTDVVVKLTNDILEGAVEAGADAIAVACPMCHANLDMRQKKIEKEYKRKFNIPIVYISELIGLSLGLGSIGLGLDKHFVDTKSVVNAYS